MVIEYFNEDRLSSYSTYSSGSQILKVKTCTCSIGKETCPSHSSERLTSNGCFKHDSLKLSDISLNNVKHCFTTQSSGTITPTRIEPATFIYDELKLSLSSLTSDKDIIDNPKDTENAFQRWLAEKNRRRKEELNKQGKIQKYIEYEKEKKLEMEQQNFSAWLQTKRERAKLEQKLIQQKELENRKNREEKEQKEKFAQVKFKLWMKQKEEQLLINKMKNQIKKIKSEQEKQKRMQESVEAYEAWLKSSKNKPKPVPNNQGLDSLRTSVSVSFINPTPWVPNIESEDISVSK